MRTLCIVLSVSLLAFAFIGGDSELSWGFHYLASMPLWFKSLSFLFVGFAFVVAFKSNEKEIVVSDKKIALIMIAILASFLLLPSAMLYGDSAYTLRHLTNGELINWKEPLDRFITAMAYQIGNYFFSFSARDAVRLVSTFAGAIWLGAIFWLTKIYSKSEQATTCILLLFLTPGLIQLFYGNIENYSLLAAFTLLTLTAGILALKNKDDSGFLCSLLFGLTFCIHLSAGWLGLGILFLSFVIAKRKNGSFSYSSLFKQWLWMLTAFLVPVVPTLILTSILMNGVSDLSFEYIGGGDGLMFKPIFEKTSRYEKYLMFEADHFLALVNEFVLLASAGLIITVCYAPSALKKLRSDSNKASEIIFSALSLLGAFLYVFTFNPDMSVHNVGILNEWDLFSLPGIPLLLMAFQFLIYIEPSPVWRRRVLFSTCSVSLVLTASWILHNAKVF